MGYSVSISYSNYFLVVAGIFQYIHGFFLIVIIILYNKATSFVCHTNDDVFIVAKAFKSKAFLFR